MPDEGPASLPVIGDRYAVTERIGKGGAAGVYLVFDQNLARWRAAKVLHRRYSDNAELRARFLREARTMALLDHPNVVRVLDVSDVTPPYMIMEYIDGGCVLDWLRLNGVMPPFMAVQVMIDVCKALAATHAEAIVHRDVKPHNVLVTAKGVCKLTDYGIAKVDATAADLAVDEIRTQVGASMGSDAFMSPEQRSDASSVDSRSDIYSAGATLFTLCTRKAAVDLCMLTADDPKLQDVPESLRDVILKACHHRPDERYQRIEELEEALQALLWALPSVPDAAPRLVQAQRDLPRRPPSELQPENLRELRDLLSLEEQPEPEVRADFPLEPEPTPVPQPSLQGEPPIEEAEGGSSPLVVGALAVAFVLALLLGGGVGATRSGAASVNEARVEAQAALVVYLDAIAREQQLISVFAEAGADRAPLERAFFALQDASEPDRLEAAERYWSALEAASVEVGARAAGARAPFEALQTTRAQWVEAHSGWESAASSVTGWLAVSLGMTAAP